MAGDQPRSGIEAPPGDSQMTRDEIVAFFNRRQRALENLDSRALAADYADDCVVESPLAGMHRGRAAVQEVFQALFDGFPDLKIQPERLVIDGPYVVQFVRCEGTDLGGFLGLKPTEKAFQVSLVYLYELHGNKIAREQRIYDFTGVLLQIGVLKAKPV